MSSYAEFLASKSSEVKPSGISVGSNDIHDSLFGFQKDIVIWALRMGKAAIFADTGLGKTRMQVEWARHISKHGRVLILAPLAVAHQTVREAASIGVNVEYCREDTGARITITNYEMLDAFDADRFAGIILDESSILKSYTGSTRNQIINAFQDTPYRLACTATPSPNDHMELGNHSEFLGCKTRVEMLAEYFVHDGGETQKWRLKGHSVDPFWEWVSSWGLMIRKPSDLGYDDSGFDLPKLTESVHLIKTDHTDAQAAGLLFHPDALTLGDQRKLRRSTEPKRIKAASDIANSHAGPVLIWCDYNSESDAVTKAIPDAVEVKGSDSIETKTDRLLGFADGKYRVLVTKPSIAGFGMNWQHCNRMIFMGPSHSYEQTYQAIRRCWRFGQKNPVEVTTICSELETAVLKNQNRKKDDADTMAEMTRPHLQKSIAGNNTKQSRHNDYIPTKKAKMPKWLKH